MTNNWPQVRLGEVLRSVPRPVAVKTDALYREIGIRSHGKGVFHKNPVSGLELGNKKVFWVQPGDFVLNIVFAWEGAVAVLGDAEAGMIGSHRFPTFRADESRLDSSFLLAYFRTPEGLDLLGRVSPGGAGRNRTLSRTAFLKQLIPLPPIEVQRKLVANIQGLTRPIEEALALRRQSELEAAAIIRAALRRLTDEIPVTGKLGDVLSSPPRNGWSARCDNAEGGTPVLALGAVTGFRYQRTQFKRTSLPVPKDGHYWLRPGDLLMTRSNTPDLVGHAAIYDGNPAPCIYPDLIMRLDLKSSTADCRFIWYWLQSAIARNFISRSAKGTSPTMKKISQRVVMDIPFPSQTSLGKQHEIVSQLDDLQAAVDQLRALQSATGEEIKAMFPAVLSRAFAGEV